MDGHNESHSLTGGFLVCFESRTLAVESQGGSGATGQFWRVTFAIGIPRVAVQLDQVDGSADTSTSGGVSLLGDDVGYPDVSLKSAGWTRSTADPGFPSQWGQPRSARRFRQKQPAVALQLAKEKANSSIISKVDVIIDNHVIPNSWSRDYVVPSVDVRYCIGVHPRMVNGFIPWRKLEARFQDNRCVGIG